MSSTCKHLVSLRSKTQANFHCALLLLVLLPSTSAQQQHSDTRGQQDQDTHLDYHIGPGDVLSIGVFGAKDFDQTIRVSNSGKIHVPYVGVLVVADMTPSQIESEIAKRLREKQLVKDPWVQVNVSEFRAHPVYILGEVMQPGQFLIKNDMYLTDLISLAGAFNDVASPVGYLYRLGLAQPKPMGSSPEIDTTGRDSVPEEAIKIDFRALYEGNQPELNLKLRGGDVLYVPQRREEFFFVIGEVLKPGAIKIPPNDKVMATQAIASAGGPQRTAKMSKGLLVRYDQAGVRQELAVDFKAIITGKSADFPVRANDIIFIPGSSAKTIAYGMLGIIPGIVSGLLVF